MKIKTKNEEIGAFYCNLYKSNFFEMIRGINKMMDDNFKQHMEKKLRTEELDRAIVQMSKGKSSGLHGLTEFYSFFWNDIRELLYNAFLECISDRNLSLNLSSQNPAKINL